MRLKPLLIILFLCAFFAFLAMQKKTSSDKPSLSSANTYYREGVEAKTAGRRTEKFRLALQDYLTLEKSYNPLMGSGRLYYNIGNTYFQLTEYPSAIYYYERAHALMPRDPLVLQNLAEAQKALHIDASKAESPFKPLFIAHHIFSIPEKIQSLTFFTLLAFLCFSYHLWRPSKWTGRLRWGFLSIAGLIFLSLFYSLALAPTYQIVLQSSSLLRGPAATYAKVMEAPVPAGTKVELLDSLEKGAWLKVELPNGQIGYLGGQCCKNL